MPIHQCKKTFYTDDFKAQFRNIVPLFSSVLLYFKLFVRDAGNLPEKIEFESLSLIKVKASRWPVFWSLDQNLIKLLGLGGWML